jgi:hypothetical protein
MTLSAFGLLAVSLGINARNAWMPGASLIDNTLGIGLGVMVGVIAFALGPRAWQLRGARRLIALGLLIAFVGFDVVNTHRFATDAVHQGAKSELMSTVRETAQVSAMRCAKHDRECEATKALAEHALRPSPPPAVDLWSWLWVAMRTVLPTFGGLVLMVARSR